MGISSAGIPFVRIWAKQANVDSRGESYIIQIVICRVRFVKRVVLTAICDCELYCGVDTPPTPEALGRRIAGHHSVLAIISTLTPTITFSIFFCLNWILILSKLVVGSV